MWATAAGERWLVAADPDVADFVAGIYHFDRVVVSPLEVDEADGEGDGPVLGVHAPDLGLELHLEAGRGWPLPLPRRRPAWFTRRVEAPVARRLLGVEAYGVSPTGVREWYQASRYRPVTTARATLHGADLGLLGPLRPAVAFGFSEPPRRPSLVEVTTVLEQARLPPGRSPRPGPG
ncbi:MAG: hypothetical protein QOI99_439 [Actinomycetota bacterium]|nr:hypothetical protein [Actinomycetota bacterium]